MLLRRDDLWGLKIRIQSLHCVVRMHLCCWACVADQQQRAGLPAAAIATLQTFMCGAAVNEPAVNEPAVDKSWCETMPCLLAVLCCPQNKLQAVTHISESGALSQASVQQLKAPVESDAGMQISTT